MNSKKIKVVFISEAIRRDSHAPLRFFENIEVIHLYLSAPYGDMKKEDFVRSRKVKLENLLGEIIKEKPDIIQGAEPFGSRLSLRLSYIAQKATRLTSAKLVVPILENRPIEERFNLAGRAALRIFCPGYFMKASAVVVLNNGAEENVKAYAPKAKIVSGIVWGVWGVDTELFKPVESKKEGQIVYVGRWIEDKGLKYMMEGFLKALEEIPDLKLLLIGQGAYEKEMRSFAQDNGIEKNIEFIGQLKNTELPKYFSSSELCIYPSITQKRWEEQVGTVNFQAMSCGTPVLTTRSGAIPEYIEDQNGAILVPERDSKAIAAQVIKYFSDKDYKYKLQKQSRPFILRYDVRGEIAKAEELLLKIAYEK